METKLLRELCVEIVDCPHSTPSWTSAGKIVIRNFNIQHGKIDFSNPSFTDQEHYLHRIKRAKPEGGDLVITREAPMGQVGMIPSNVECCLGQRMVLLKVDRTVCNPYYLLYALQSPAVQFQIKCNEGTGTTVSNLRIPILEHLEIPFVNKENQDRIAAFLKLIDDKIEANNKIIKNLEEQLCLLYKSFILYKENFIGIKPVSELFTISIGKTPPRKETEWFSKKETDIKWVSISDMGKSYPYIQNTSEYITKEAAEKFKIKVVPDNTILLSFKLTLGRICITDGEMATNEAIAHFPIEDESILEYLYCYLRTFNYETLGNTSSIATALNSKIIKNMQIPVPKNDELDRFHHLTAPLLQQIKILSRQQSVLQNIREALLTKLISSEIELKNQ